MEQRQPDEPGQQHNIPSTEPVVDAQSGTIDVSDSQTPAQQLGEQPVKNRQENPQRNHRNGDPKPANEVNAPVEERPNRQVPNQRENRQQNDRNTGQRESSQRENRQQTNGQRPNEARQRDNRPDRERANAGAANQTRDFIADGEGTRDSGNVTTPEPSGRSDDRLVIGISLGDYNGIGPEVILKALQYNRLQKICTPVIYGSMRILNRYRNLLNMKDWNLNGAQSIGQISHKLTNVITCWPDQNQDIQPGRVTPEAGQAAFACLQRAVDDLKDGKLDALVTAPINKYNIQSEEFKFPGHTEYLAQEFGVQDNLMFMVSETLRVGVVTGHVPLGRVRQNVTRDRILQKLSLMTQSLKQDFGIEKPKIAVLGLNPHAGEEGLLGNEEQDIIKPLLTELRNKGQLVFGPYPADGFFGTRGYRNFDAVLAMYHDQGLIPFKSIAFEEGVNFTAGMPAIRTSPDHGTAYDIAGKDLADETSMLQAIYTAIDVARNRKEFLELEAGALKKQSVEK
ncbi:4-hydroxythreonine-4-phosphate dehydrogenase PdxA [Spirosoma validum]|uniref:4-hydroxythreonine-4-phosphate dehydrogenase PdxA n=1 Tax=Spirosoma validum TaxID=2771355 RepID=A0A927AXU9_9BACT|nr:4-hydroxythreonine-4-phosphate dehydrogenase PdxA [Spirosoma validum]MBD2751682.1 4-hydroxythreonine-4-phosphate dehydrogenase PdxA [Spirosoma validum]